MGALLGNEEKPTSDEDGEEIITANIGEDSMTTPGVGDDSEEGEAENGIYIAVRKEVRSLSEAETERLVKAIKRMMQNDSGPDTSEYLRISNYHGDYCAHRNEQFPVWHRAYLVEMEKGLQAADLKNGGDGKIALPYWDWADRTQKDLIPEFIRREFPNAIGLKEDPDWILNQREFQMPSDNYIKQSLDQIRINRMVDRFLLEDEHFKAATSEVSPENLESPHDRIHVITGWPMTSVPYAAYNPLFYLHHSNVDRLYEKYIMMHKDSEQEFEAVQDMKEEQGGENLYDAWCEPFHFGEEKFLPMHCYDTKKLGYVYDELPPTPAEQFRELPIYAVFFDIFMPDLNKKSYTAHVFLQLKSEESPAPLPFLPEEFCSDKRYAGWTAFFGGRGRDCENCVKGEPVNYYVELNEALFALEVDAYEVNLDVILFDEHGERVELDDASGVPRPKIRGPWFTRKQHLTTKVESEEFHGEAYMVQKYLAKFGWYIGKIDGWFGTNTHSALIEFQKALGLKTDGIASEITKSLMGQPRYDGHKDVLWKMQDDEKTDRVHATMQRNYPKGTTVKYHIGRSPAYLKRDSVVRDIDAAFDSWNEISDKTGVVFEKTLNVEDRWLRVQWSNLSPKNDRRFDGKGGMLAESTKGELSYDISERWLTADLEPRVNRREFYLREVTAHEIGHVLGLGHCLVRDSLMNPFYEQGRLKPTDHEVKAVNDLVAAVM